MTITMNPLAGSADVRARREAALDRLHGGKKKPGERGSPRRTKPSRRAVQQPQPRLIENLGPPPGVYYGIAVVVAVFVMLGLVMVLSATNTLSGDRLRWETRSDRSSCSKFIISPQNSSMDVLCLKF